MLTLRAAGCVFAEDEAALLRADSRSAQQLRAMIERRVAGEPIEHILGWTLFCGRRMATAPGVFVPRRRSEFLVEQAARVTRPGSTVVDLCCGCGALGAALRERVAELTLHAADIDDAAVRCAQENLGPDTPVHRGDLFDALPEQLRGRIDTLIANVPYVPTAALATMPPEAREHEARVALDGGADGLGVARRLAEGAARWLAQSGYVLIETSAGQAGAAIGVFNRAGLHAGSARDESRDATVVWAHRPVARGSGR